MDKIAKQHGLMHTYTVLDTATDNGAWNGLMSVTYLNDKGYNGIAPASDKIRQAHTTVRVDGKILSKLGSIVESKRLFESPESPTQP